MRKVVLALATAATVGATAIAAPAPAEAGGFRGFGPGLAGGLKLLGPSSAALHPARTPTARDTVTTAVMHQLTMVAMLRPITADIRTMTIMRQYTAIAIAE